METKDEYMHHVIDKDMKFNVFKNETLPVKNTLGKEGFKFTFINWKGEECKIEISHTTKEIIDQQISLVSNNFDSVGLVTGMEGSAKTTLAITNIAPYICYRLGTTFSVDNVGMSVKQFDEMLEKANIGDVIILDEFILMGAAEDTMTGIQSVLRKKFTLIRKKRLFIVLILPSIHMMNKYFAMQRTRYLIDCRTTGARRGSAVFYGYNKKNYLGINGRKTFTYSGFTYDKELHFLDLRNKSIVGNDIIDWDAYEAKKDSAIKALLDSIEAKEKPKEVTAGESKRSKRLNVHRTILVKELQSLGKTQGQIALSLGITRESLNESIQQYEPLIETYRETGKV